VGENLTVPWRIAGTYLEACNCDAICPCRMVGGVPGGRSTHGVCYGALAWRVEEGEHAGSAALMTFSYDDDEPGSPWKLILHVDGPQELADILLGRRGGKHVLTLPWVRKHSDVVAVRRSDIEFGDGEVRAGEEILLRATTPVPTDETVTCIVPGHERAGRELYADELRVADGPFAWELHGTCAYASSFDYSD
jgi:hypothetical protein